MDPQTRAELTVLRARRQRLSHELRDVDIEMGRVASSALAESPSTSKSSIGRLLGFSHTHVSNLIDASAAAPNPASREIPIVRGEDAGMFIHDAGARVVRSVSGFSEADVLEATGVDPRLLSERDSIRPPNMMWLLDTGEWVGIDNVNVGYGGGGPRAAKTALLGAGISESIAEEIVYSRFCDTNDALNGSIDGWTRSDRWPVYSRGIPLRSDDRMIVMFGDGLYTRHDSLLDVRGRPEVDENGFYPSATGISRLDAWLAFLDDTAQLPHWAQGVRVARVFRNDAAASEAGFVAAPFSPGRSSQAVHPSVVIEQGDVQLWGVFPREGASAAYLPEKAWEVLAKASVYPDDLRRINQQWQHPFLKFVKSLGWASDKLPDMIDISASGQDALDYVPSSPVEYVTGY